MINSEPQVNCASFSFGEAFTKPRRLIKVVGAWCGLVGITLVIGASVHLISRSLKPYPQTVQLPWIIFALFIIAGSLKIITAVMAFYYKHIVESENRVTAFTLFNIAQAIFEIALVISELATGKAYRQILNWVITVLFLLDMTSHIVLAQVSHVIRRLIRRHNSSCRIQEMVPRSRPSSQSLQSQYKPATDV